MLSKESENGEECGKIQKNGEEWRRP